jgi:hypothetical protein
LVLLVLAIVWGALLVSWLRSRAQETFSDSVGSFRHHLRVLEKAAPSTVPPAHRLRPSYTPIPEPRAIAARRIAAVGVHPGAGRPVSSTSLASIARRRAAQRRRRDVLLTLLAGVFGSMLLAALSGVGATWVLQVAFDLALVGYVALLVRMRNLAAERDMKLRFMPYGGKGGYAQVGYGEVGYGQVGYGQVGYGQVGYGQVGYGQLSVRRAAN